MELWDVYNRDREKTGRTAVRGSELEVGDYHLVIHVCIFNKAGQMLIQQRQSYKEGWPGLWDISVGGSAVKGENSQMAAEREVLEELGINLDLQSIRPKLTIQFERGFDDVYLVEKEVDLKDLKLQEEEVQDAKWVTKEEILQMIESEEFIPYYKNLIRLFFDMRNQYGCIQHE